MKNRLIQLLDDIHTIAINLRALERHGDTMLHLIASRGISVSLSQTDRELFNTPRRRRQKKEVA